MEGRYSEKLRILVGLEDLVFYSVLLTFEKPYKITDNEGRGLEAWWLGGLVAWREWGLEIGDGDWGLGIGVWALEIWDWGLGTRHWGLQIGD